VKRVLCRYVSYFEAIEKVGAKFLRKVMKLSNKLLFAFQISDLSAAISGGLSSPDFTSLGRALSLYIKISVVDQDLLNPDTNPVPAFQVNPDPDTDPGF
jgi:hypothetical protein